VGLPIPTYNSWVLAMGDVRELFPKKVDKVTVEVDPLTYWKLRNEVISDEFIKYNAYEKQEILDTVLQMNLELYGLVIKLKERLNEN
jgi:hypothetical protein